MFFALATAGHSAPGADDGTPAPSQAQNNDKDEAARTAAQTKLDSQIVLALKKSRGEPPFDKVTKLQPDLAIRPDGRVLVDLDAAVSKELETYLEASGGQIVNSFERYHAIRAVLPLARLEAIAARADVRFIRPADQATTNPRDDRPASSGAIKPNNP